jgi:DNA-directed RNA polymerase specialized sigma24 family protein
MDPDPKNRASTASNATSLPELLDRVHAGHAGAAEQLHGILYPGVHFLIQRRLGRYNVDREAQSVLEAAIRGIQADASMPASQVNGLVRRLIQQRFDGKSQPAETAIAVDGGRSARIAERILERMSPVERNALRRCYVLGEAPESFLKDLNLTLEDFRTIQSRARAEFSSKKSKTNVA